MNNEKRANDLVVRSIALAAQNLEERLNLENDALGECNIDGSSAIDVCEQAVMILRELAKAHHDEHVRDQFADCPLFQEAE